MDYEMIIGLEIHAELATKSKIYCSCTTEFGGDVNTHTCPICIGMPGVLPVLNKKVVEFAVKAGLSTNCTIAKYSKQDRKNYFYPDLPKAYQVSQYDLPLCNGGFVNIDIDGEQKKLGITRIHIEEDAGKLLHDESETSTLVDYNRCGVPLIEIVGEPDIRSAKEAKAYVESIKSILEYIEVSDCKMQEGSLRVDVNLSVRPIGQQIFGTRTEMKNLNSLRSIVRAIEAESNRQIAEISKGGTIIQETRRWDDNKGVSYSMRSKEDAHDYRYFPEPDLVPIVVNDEWLQTLQSEIPELPETRKTRYMEKFTLPSYDAWILTSSKQIADFFEQAVQNSSNPKAISNWIMGDLMKMLKENNQETQIGTIPILPQNLTKLVSMIDDGKISGAAAKKVFEKMFQTGVDPETIVKSEGLEIVSDETLIRDIVTTILKNNPKSVEDYKSGKEKAFGFIVGQAMRQTKGTADAQIVNKIIREELDK